MDCECWRGLSPQGPFVGGCDGKDSFGGVASAILDTVCLVQDDAMPVIPVTNDAVNPYAYEIKRVILLNRTPVRPGSGPRGLPHGAISKT